MQAEVRSRTGEARPPRTNVTHFQKRGPSRRECNLLFSYTVNRKNNLLLLAALVLAALCLVGCTPQPSIADINRDPGRFSGKEITIRGQASDSFGGFGAGLFQVDDGTGRIWVLSQNFGLPGNGSKVSVTGQVQQGFSFNGRNYGIIFRQTKALE